MSNLFVSAPKDFSYSRTCCSIEQSITKVLDIRCLVFDVSRNVEGGQKTFGCGVFQKTVIA